MSMLNLFVGWLSRNSVPVLLDFICALYLMTSFSDSGPAGRDDPCYFYSFSTMMVILAVDTTVCPSIKLYFISFLVFMGRYCLAIPAQKHG